jgi:hypothetical protein
MLSNGGKLYSQQLRVFSDPCRDNIFPMAGTSKVPMVTLTRGWEGCGGVGLEVLGS